MKRKLIIFIKRFYQLIPIKNTTKQKIKNKLIKHVPFFRNIQNYSDMNLAPKQLDLNNIHFTNELNFKINKKIAVHLHLYYIDLAEEFINYFNNIPYKFDLYISVATDEVIKCIENKFKSIKNVEKVIVKKAGNFGRDFGPMFVLFKNDLEKYDYILHCHSKKSIRTGEQQDGWRQHMMDSLLKDENLVKQIFYQFEKGDNIGLIYPETYSDMPYWAHTWLYNKPESNKIANRLGFTLDDEYIDYSVGSFFWVKIDSIKNFLDFNYTKKDFGEENGKNDGTLAHAIERMIPQVVKNNKYNYLVIDISNNCFRKSGLKNMYQYNEQNATNIYEKIKNYDIISFDIFDTLITRKIYNPSDLIGILESYVKKTYKIIDFKRIRINAEYNVRVSKDFKGDCSIDEIYENIKELTNLDDNQCKKIKEKEIELELDFIIPRKEMLELYNWLKKDNKKIILISDMYLTSDIIKKMLNKCGYDNWDELLVSSEVGYRKDNGAIWEYYFNNYTKNKSTIHIGDNEHSDIQRLCDMGKPFIHVMQSKKMFCLSNYATFINNYKNKRTIGDEVALGLIVNKQLYNNPFKFNETLYGINTYNELGYTIFGPIFAQFFNYLAKECEKNNTDELLFLAREGYFLEPLYQKYCKILKIKPVKSKYFLTSRRSTSVACIETMEDVKEIMMSGYEGSIKNLYKTRLGLDLDIEDKFIKLESSKDEVLKNIEDNFNVYKKIFNKERNNYLKYCKKNIKGKNVAVVDLGYSGTIQYYLIKLLNKKINGYYFILTDNIKPLKLGGKASFCYNFKSETCEKNIYNFSMILESFLTAPIGQLIKFDDDGNPIYKNENIDESFIEKLKQINDGIFAFFDDYLVLAKKYNLNLSGEFIGTNFSSLVYTDILNPQIKQDFKLENSYSLDSTINVFEYLNLVYMINKTNDKKQN